MAANWWYSKQLPRVSYIKLLPLTADLPAPADLASIAHHTNGDLYVDMLVTNHHQYPLSMVPLGPWTKPNTKHTTLSYYQTSCIQISFLPCSITPETHNFLPRKTSSSEPPDKYNNSVVSSSRSILLMYLEVVTLPNFQVLWCLFH